MSEKFQLRRQLRLGGDNWTEPEVLAQADDCKELTRQCKELNRAAAEEGNNADIIIWVTPTPPEKRR